MVIMYRCYQALLSHWALYSTLLGFNWVVPFWKLLIWSFLCHLKYDNGLSTMATRIFHHQESIQSVTSVKVLYCIWQLLDSKWRFNLFAFKHWWSHGLELFCCMSICLFGSTIVLFLCHKRRNYVYNMTLCSLGSRRLKLDMKGVELLWLKVIP